jgi:hypothetical protein
VFGFGKSAAVRDLGQRFGQVLSVLASGGAQRADDAIGGIRTALGKASDKARMGISDIHVARFLATESQSDMGPTSGRSLGYLLVSMMYEARSIGTKEALTLASQIQDVASDMMVRFPDRSTSSTDNNAADAPQPDDISDEQLEATLRFARVLQRVLVGLGIYSESPYMFHEPQALGYIWGWCDAATQKLGFPRNSGESLGACAGMFISFFEQRLFDPNAEEGYDAEFFALGNRLRDEGDSDFMVGMQMGGSDLFSFVNSGDSCDAIMRNVATVFSDE